MNGLVLQGVKVGVLKLEDPDVRIHSGSILNYRVTLPETNIAPENRPSQKETIIPTIHFQ